MALPLQASAASSQGDDETIITAIQRDSLIIIEQPEALMSRLVKAGTSEGAENTNDNASETKQAGSDAVSSDTPPTAAGTVKTAGYRIQVFSDNNARTAKSEARSKAQAISARLPQYSTYVVFQSPYWRLKVGDFLTRTEAENAADEIKKIFPAFSREVRVVKDRINK